MDKNLWAVMLVDIGDASRITAISKDMIRHYEKLGLIRPARKENGYRDFSEDDLNTLVAIRMLSNSHIPLKQIRQAFRTDSVDGLIEGLSAELEHLHRMQKQINVWECAVRSEIDHMKQYADLRNPVLYHYPERWFVAKSSQMDDVFGQKCQEILEAGDYFQYVARWEIDFREKPAVLSPREQGILLFREYPEAKYIPEQDSLRFIATHAADRILNREELVSFAETALQFSPRTTVQIFAHQFFRNMGKKEACAVCVEVLLGS